MGQPGNTIINRLGVNNFWHYNTVTTQNLQGNMLFAYRNVVIASKLFFRLGFFYIHRFFINNLFWDTYGYWRSVAVKTRFRYYRIFKTKLQYGFKRIHKYRRIKRLRFYSRIWFLIRHNWLIIKFFVYNPKLPGVLKIKRVSSFRTINRVSLIKIKRALYLKFLHSYLL